MDALLVQQTLDGDDKAFGQLVQKYQSSVYKICLSIVKNPQDAEELSQDVFVCAYQKLAQLEEPEKFQQWLKKIAQNLSKSQRRRLKAVHEVTLTQIQDEPASMPSSEDFDKLNPADLMLRQELIDAVMAAIESLPQKDRQVIKAYIDGFDHKEISQKMGLSYRASINRLYRIRREITQKVKHLLNGIAVLFKLLSLKKCLEGGIMTMKITTSAKIGAIAVGTIAIILAGSIGVKLLLEPDEKGVADSHKITAAVHEVTVEQSEQVQPQTTTKTPLSATAKKPVSVSTQVSKEELSEEELREFEALLTALETSLSDVNQVPKDSTDEIETRVKSADSLEYAALEELIRERIQLIREWKIATYELNRFVPSYVMSNGRRVYELKDENDPNKLYIKAELAAWRAVEKNSHEIAMLFPNAVANIQYDEDGTPFVVGKMKLDFGKIEQALRRPLPHAQELLWVEKE